ncbi:hypothetical protein K6Q96_14770 [Grimontia kaedaensis]|uniref:Uncharacterized protein n=1 Tax=Grimontia kaedaensis TaxID=2872157 RepID=A0ABY4WRA6_9GAMM|nr:hypothetical protein [Grimontia kaedaensis]USH02111.1 hypothetical protein K6Q96_14770 [Grimontia kaedaensis]
MYSILDEICDRGYVKIWFTWIEWLTLTAAIFLGANAWDSLLLYVIGAISSIFVWWSACRAIISAITGFLLPKNINKLIKKAIAISFGCITPAVVLITVVNLMSGFIMAS